MSHHHKISVVTGGANGIGRCITEELLKAITIDGGMGKQMIYHGDGGWTYRPGGQS